MTAFFIATGCAGTARVPLQHLMDASQASRWFVDVETYHRGLDREGMWLRARGEGGSVAEDVRDWGEFMADWRSAHPAGIQGSYCETFEVERVEVDGQRAIAAEICLP